MAFDPHVAVLGLLTTGVGYLMIVAGLHKGMLEWRRSSRRCPSCGHEIQERVYGFCTGRS
jgi:hypothetical protein